MTTGYDRAPVPKRPVFSKELGEYFTSLRIAKGWKQSQAADIAQRLKIKLSYQALRGLEGGRTKNLQPKILRAVASLYKVPYEDLFTEVAARQFGIAASKITEASQTKPDDDAVSLQNSSLQTVSEETKKSVQEPIGVGADSSVSVGQLQSAERDFREATERLNAIADTLAAHLAALAPRPGNKTVQARVGLPSQSGRRRKSR